MPSTLAARGLQAAVAGDGQVALDFNADFEGSVAAYLVFAGQVNDQRAVGENAAAVLFGGDFRVIQRQGVGIGVVADAFGLRGAVGEHVHGRSHTALPAL